MPVVRHVPAGVVKAICPDAHVIRHMDREYTVCALTPAERHYQVVLRVGTRAAVAVLRGLECMDSNWRRSGLEYQLGLSSVK